MKKLFWTMLLIAAAAVSCNKDSAPADHPVDWSRYDASKFLVSFTGTLEQTKVTVNLDEGSLAWEAGDKVLVQAAAGTAQYQYNTDGKFYPVDEDNLLALTEGETVHMYYPYDAFTVNGTQAVYTMDEGVMGVEDLGDKNPLAAAYTPATDEGASFKNLCSILRVRLTGKRTVSSVVLGNDDVALAAGSEFAVSWSEGGIPAVTTSSTGKSMTITGNYPLDETTPTDFCFLLPPSAASMSNMTLTVNLTTADEGGETSVVLSRSGAMALSRNKIVKLSFYAGLFSGGTGTEADPYKIATARDFKNLQNYTAAGYGTLTGEHFYGAHYLQTADIDFDGATLTKIGAYINATTYTSAFTGVYDGDSHTLSNFVIKEPTVQGVGLFAVISEATLKNMILSGITVQGKSYVGGLVGFAVTSTVKDCIVGGTVQSNGGATGGVIGYVYQGGTVSGCRARELSVCPIDSATGNNYGGIIGYIPNNGTITVTDCHAEATSSVSSGMQAQTGGIIGTCALETTANATISNCSNAATVTNGMQRAGGIVGSFVNGTISKCTNSGTITLNVTGTTTSHKNGNSTGGIAGYAKNGVIESCTNTGEIKSNKPHTGGIVGYTQATVTVTKCVNAGKVNSTSSNTGGIVGYAYSAPTVSLCYSHGPFVTGNTRIGGVVGHINGANAWIVNCISDQDVISTLTPSALDDGKNGAAGGIVGTFSSGTVANCLHTDKTVISRNSGHSDATQPFTCVSGLVGHARGGTMQNCYTLVSCDKLGAGVSGTTVTIPSSDAGSQYMGQLFGYIEAGTLKDCYALNDASAGYSQGTSAGTLSNATILGGGTVQGYLNHACNSIVTYSDGTTGTTVTLSDGTTSFAAGSTYPVDILNGGAALISGYTGSALTWQEVPTQSNYPLPSALVALMTE